MTAEGRWRRGGQASKRTCAAGELEARQGGRLHIACAACLARDTPLAPLPRSDESPVSAGSEDLLRSPNSRGLQHKPERQQ